MAIEIGKDGIRRVLVSLIADELANYRNKKTDVLSALKWTDDVTLDEEGLGFDSLGLLSVSGRVNQFFHLHEVGVEDYLLARRSIGEWVDIVAQSLGLKFERLSFQTSGSTGTPKKCEQEVAWLAKDASAVADLIAPSSRIITLVPPHHIFGFIYTVLMPATHDMEVLDARILGPGKLKSELRETDIVVATPHLWRYALTAMNGFQKGISGITSTAPMPDDLRRLLIENEGVALYEIYGSSETNGIGYKGPRESHFTLFDWWTKGKEESVLLRQNPAASGGKEAVQLMDNLQFSNERNFVPVGRRDKAIQIGGLNVFPEVIAERIAGLGCVNACAVRAFSQAGSVDQQRLKAFIVPAKGSSKMEIEVEVACFIESELPAHERPISITYGEALPVNAMGKPVDWH